ncbi:MAG: metallophosphatase [Hyphomicrobiales bacterium]|nr:MAG: metallophosphatase [Hyphomicrobiales bacterium]
MFTLAHLTDPHIGPLPEPGFRALMGKRLSGYLSWTKNRHRIHNMDILRALTEDMRAQQPDQIALTGDIVNISLPEEFSQARRWLDEFAPPERLSLVPGNHDAYVSMPYAHGLGKWQDYMSSNAEAAPFLPPEHQPFPWLRLFGNIAMIGLSSAEPTWPFVAGGHVGRRQFAILSELLAKLGAENFFRIVLIHHPPLPGFNSFRKGLWDAEELRSVLCTHGAELVLHGHNHRAMFSRLEGPGGPIAIAGAPSASARKSARHPAAGYYLFDIEQIDGSWHCSSRVRNLNEGHSGFVDGEALFSTLVYS